MRYCDYIHSKVRRRALSWCCAGLALPESTEVCRAFCFEHRLTLKSSQAYEITEFIAAHPGGAAMVELSAGRDSTIMYESGANKNSLPLPRPIPTTLEAMRKGWPTNRIDHPNESTPRGPHSERRGSRSHVAALAVAWTTCSTPSLANGVDGTLGRLNSQTD